MIGIYAIYRKSDDVCVYVGQSKEIEKRILVHINGRSHIKINQDEYYWRVIEEYNVDDKQYRLGREAYWIDKLQPVYNKQKTGRSFFTDEAKQKISESIKGKNHPMYGKHLSNETKQKISKATKGKNISNEIRNKISKANKGKHPSDEIRNKLSESHKGEKNHMYGKHHSDETKQKISETMKGKTPWNKGKHLSDEMKQKISNTIKNFI